jgi:beta-lactamase class A
MSALLLALLVTRVTMSAGERITSPDDTSSLATRVRARIAQLPGAHVAVAYLDLGRPDSLFLDADSSFHAASTMKVPVMIELFRHADAHHLSLDQPILLINEFGSIADGSPYTLDPKDDSDTTLYTMVGTRVPVRELLEHMITRSSNLATNALIALVGGGAHVTATMRALGASRIQVRRGVEDTKAYQQGLNNTTTARDLATIMRAIERNEAASPASCAHMRDILLRQEFNDEIPAGLPRGTPVAHKTGQITAVLHDAAVVYPQTRPPYVLVVLTSGIPNEKVARSLMADVSRLVYDHAMARHPGTAASR